jgi:ankyrin repeat protein
MLRVEVFLQKAASDAMCLWLQAGAKPGLHNASGITAVLAAAGHGQAVVLQLLRRHVGPEGLQALAAATDVHGRNTLHFAAASGEVHKLGWDCQGPSWGGRIRV